MKLEPYMMNILSKKFESITRKMANVLVLTGRSGVLVSARDFSNAIVTSDVRLLASAEGLPVHVLGIEKLVGSMLEFFDDIAPGDAFLHNSPYHGNTHQADHTIIIPVFYNGEFQFAVLTKAHQADIGNSRPTTYTVFSKDIYEEGALNFPCVRIQRHYKDIKDLIRMIKMRIRVPDQWYGDYLGMVASARTGEKELHELFTQYGVETIKSFVNQWFEYSEKRMINEIRKLPKITVEGEIRHDPVPGVAEEGIPIRAKIIVEPDECYITIDLTQNIECVKGGINLSESTASSYPIIGIMNCLDYTIPHNSGSLSRIKVKLKENCVVGIPKHPTCCSVATTNLGGRLVNLIQRLFNEIDEKKGIAEGKTGQPATQPVISGVDKRNGNNYINQIHSLLGGGPASYGHDGWVNYGNPTTAGLMHKNSVELNEQKYPIIYHEQSIIPDKVGYGEWNGSPAIKMVFEPRWSPMRVSYTGDCYKYPPKGILGGHDGSKTYIKKIDDKGKETRLPLLTDEVEIKPGEKVVAIDSSGGGYGDSLNRHPERVLLDLQREFITIETAKKIYGVVIEGVNQKEFKVDYEATNNLRRKKRKGIKTKRRK